MSWGCGSVIEVYIPSMHGVLDSTSRIQMLINLKCHGTPPQPQHLESTDGQLHISLGYTGNLSQGK